MNEKKQKPYREEVSEKTFGKLPYRKRKEQEEEALKQIEELYFQLGREDADTK